MVQADLAAVGIPVAIFVESTSQIVERLTVTREYDLVLLAVEVQAASLRSSTPTSATSDMPGNLNGSQHGFPADTEFDALLLAAVQAPEDEAGCRLAGGAALRRRAGSLPDPDRHRPLRGGDRRFRQRLRGLVTGRPTTSSRLRRAREVTGRPLPAEQVT